MDTSMTLAEQNDEFRRTMGTGRLRGDVLATRHLQLFGIEIVKAAIEAVKNDTVPENDVCDHTLGAVRVDGVVSASGVPVYVNWTIDYYADERYDSGSRQPANPDCCVRTITLRLGEEIE